MRGIHETNHTEEDLWATVPIVPSEPGLVEILFELRDDGVPILREPCYTFLPPHLDGIVELLPGFDNPSSDLADLDIKVPPVSLV